MSLQNDTGARYERRLRECEKDKKFARTYIKRATTTYLFTCVATDVVN